LPPNFLSFSWLAPPLSGPDGLKVDLKGNLFASGPGELYIFAPGGTLLGRIHLTRLVASRPEASHTPCSAYNSSRFYEAQYLVVLSM
jgi:hypothetical protein